jgi:predicted ATPase
MIKYDNGDVTFYDSADITFHDSADLGRKEHIRQVVQKIRYFPPWRRISTRFSNPSSALKEDFVIHVSEIHSYIHWFIHGKILEALDNKQENELDRVNFWAERIGQGKLFDSLIEHDVVQGEFRDKELNINVPIIDGGYGGISFLPIILEAYSFKEGILLIEEPEISLDAGAQSEILDFFREIATTRGHQIIFTSHSHYLLQKIIRHFKEERITDELMDVLFAEKTQNGTEISKCKSEELKELEKKLERRV